MMDHAPCVADRLIPIALRPGLIVWLDIPPDLTMAEAVKIGNVVKAYAGVTVDELRREGGVS